MVAAATKELDGNVSPVGYNVVNPYLTVRNIPALMDFVRETFGGVVERRLVQPDGSVEHAEIRIGDSVLMVGPPEVDSLTKSGQHPRPGTFYIFVADVDRSYHKAMEHGANCFMLPTKTFYGDRVAAVVDPSDNIWWIAHREESLNQQELQARACERWHCRREVQELQVEPN